MKPLCIVLAVVMALLLVTSGESLGAGEGRYQSITIFRGSTPLWCLSSTPKTETRGCGRKDLIPVKPVYGKNGLPSIIREGHQLAEKGPLES